MSSSPVLFLDHGKLAVTVDAVSRALHGDKDWGGSIKTRNKADNQSILLLLDEDSWQKISAIADAQLIALLENIIGDVEWSWSDATSEMSERRYNLCPMCCEHKQSGHAPNCDIGLARAVLAERAKGGEKR